MNPPSPRPPLLHLHDLGFAYPGAAAPVFAQLSAELPGGVALICGDEGTGKSTLLRLLAGQLQPAQGQVLLQGQPLHASQVAWFEAAQPERDEQVVQHILAELVPQPPQGFDTLLAELDVTPHLAKPLYQLSTGSRRKVFIAAALAQEAPLTLLDQPFTALDRPSIKVLVAHFQRWAGESQRLLLIADYLAPEGLSLNFTLDLDRLR